VQNPWNFKGPEQWDKFQQQ